MRPSSPAAARRAFVDTAAYFALADPKDANHEAAHALIKRFGTERWQLFTTRPAADRDFAMFDQCGAGLCCR